jgi:hypothetical protein
MTGPGLQRHALFSIEEITMFGKGSEHGTAVIVARQTHDGMYRKGVNLYAPTGLYHHVYDYVADVEPDGGGQAFRATFVELFQSDTEYRPTIGDRTQVKIKGQEVSFDRKVLYEMAKNAKSGHKSEFDAIANAAPGTAATAESAPVSEPVSDLTASAQRLLRLSISRAEKKGDTDAVARLTAELAKLGADV